MQKPICLDLQSTNIKKSNTLNYPVTLSDHLRSQDSPQKTKKKSTFRRYSQDAEDQQITEQKPSQFQIYGNSSSKNIEERSNQKHQDNTIEPFKIRDFIPAINPQQKSELISKNKSNFLDFLFIQKIGRSGDQKFFESLIHQYSYDPFKKSLVVQKEDTKSKISYLQKREERDDALDKQVRQVYRSLKHKRKPDEPLDQLIIQKNQYLIQRLPKIKAKLDSLNVQS